MKRDLDSSDPLPYSQVDRAVKPKAALLAGHLGVTPQHALGSLVEFWDLCAGDQRDLEAILAATPAGVEPAVILDTDDVALRFQLASGHKVEPVVLARLGLLEPTGQRYRVRGMSRYFRPLLNREANRENGAKGGKASASKRSSPGPTPASTPAQAVAQAVAQPPPQPVGQPVAQQAVSMQQSASSIQHPAGAGRPLLETAIGFWVTCQDKREAVGLMREKPPGPKLDHWFSEAMGEVGGDPEKLLRGFEAFLEDPFWRNEARQRCAWTGWVSQWRDHVTRATAPTVTAPPKGQQSLPDWGTATQTTMQEGL